jgi:glycerol-3-phosphate acyltransferase PlsY
MRLPHTLLLALASYLLGAIPFAYLIARARGVDIRKVGSGNVGATNVFRAVGKGWGVLTFALDALKGFVPAFCFPGLAVAAGASATARSAAAVLFTALAVIGHTWPAYLRFRGGKGVATASGALLGLAPLTGLIGFTAWICAFLLTRYVSVASLAACVAVPVAAWLRHGRTDAVLPAALTLLCLMVAARHHTNIRRLIAGTEHRFEFRRRRPPGPVP